MKFANRLKITSNMAVFLQTELDRCDDDAMKKRITHAMELLEKIADDYSRDITNEYSAGFRAGVDINEKNNTHS